MFEKLLGMHALTTVTDPNASSSNVFPNGWVPEHPPEVFGDYALAITVEGLKLI